MRPYLKISLVPDAKGYLYFLARGGCTVVPPAIVELRTKILNVESVSYHQGDLTYYE